MTALSEIQDTIARVADTAGAATVGIGGGSGVVVAAGQVVTNAHNLRGREPAVVFADGRRAEGEVSGFDADGDLAVVQVDTGEVTAVAWAEGTPEIGTAVLGVANPRGRGVHVTLGFVSAVERAFRGPRGRRITGGLEHTAPLPRGASGGPILDTAGRLLGINTHRLDGGLYLALPAGEGLRQRVAALVEGRVPDRARLGVAVAPPEVGRHLRAAVGLDQRDGLLIRDLDEEGPAAAAGIRAGDLLVRAGDQPLVVSDDLFAVLDALEPGATLELGVVRGAEERSISVTFGG